VIWVRVRLCTDAGSLGFWLGLGDARTALGDLGWILTREDGSLRWVPAHRLAWLSRRAGWATEDKKGRLPLEEIARVEIDLAAGLLRGTGEVTGRELTTALPFGWRLAGVKPRKTRGEGRWTLRIERYQMILFEEADL